VGGDYGGVTCDERNQRYWFNDRARKSLPGIGYRSAGLCVSDNLYTWPETVEMVFVLGEFEDYGMRYEHHGMVPFNYGDQDLCYLEVSEGGFPKMSLVGSHHDGERWSLVSQTKPLLEVGPQGARDDGIVQATRNAPLRVGDQLLIFYNGVHYIADPDKPLWLCVQDCEGTLNVGTMRLDGFAGMTVDTATSARHGKPGMIITRPVPVQNPQLEINLQGHQGSAKVVLLDEDGLTISGYELENCLPLPEDAVRAIVQWKDQPNLSMLQGQKVSLLVQMATGTIYSFRI